MAGALVQWESQLAGPALPCPPGSGRRRPHAASPATEPRKAGWRARGLRRPGRRPLGAAPGRTRGKASRGARAGRRGQAGPLPPIPGPGPPPPPEKMEAAPGPLTGRGREAEAGLASAPREGSGRGSLTGLGRAAPSPPPRRRRPRPRPPPPRAVRSVPAARLGRSAPPLSSARSCSRRQDPAAAAAAARAYGGPGAPAAAAALLLSLARSGCGSAAGPRAAFARLPEVQTLPGLAAPRSRPEPGFDVRLRSRRGRDVGRCRNAPFGLGRPRAAGRTRGVGVRAEPQREGAQRKAEAEEDSSSSPFTCDLDVGAQPGLVSLSTLPGGLLRPLSTTTS